MSIGLPVFNGEQYLSGAIDSILGQTFADLELIISDNASTDATAEICAGYEADRRVRYQRNEHNIGAAANFNRSFELAGGALFKWAAHDDLLAPDYLASCIEVLDRHPDAVLCQSVVHIVDGSDSVIEVYDHAGWNTGSVRRSERVGARLRAPRCLEVFGLIRSDALRDTVLIGKYIGADRTLLVELALRGRFVSVDRPLFINRDHPLRSTKISRAQGRGKLMEWYDPSGSRRGDFSTWRLCLTCLRLIRGHVVGFGERWRCYWHFTATLFTSKRGLLLLAEPLRMLDPGVRRLVRSVGALVGRARPRSD